MSIGLNNQFEIAIEKPCSIHIPRAVHSGRQVMPGELNTRKSRNRSHLNPKLSILAVAILPLATAIFDVALAESGVASVYSTESGNKTANGQRLNPGALTAAHRSLAFGTKVRVVNRKNGRSVVVTINDRGPFVRGRVIDVTPAAARALGFSGLTSVTLERQ